MRTVFLFSGQNPNNNNIIFHTNQYYYNMQLQFDTPTASTLKEIKANGGAGCCIGNATNIA